MRQTVGSDGPHARTDEKRHDGADQGDDDPGNESFGEGARCPGEGSTVTTNGRPQQRMRGTTRSPAAHPELLGSAYGLRGGVGGTSSSFMMHNTTTSRRPG